MSNNANIRARLNISHLWAGLIVIGVVSVISFIVWFTFWVKFVDNYELGFTYDRFNGKIVALERTGWIVRTPWRETVHTIDLRPTQVAMNANQRVLNAKLVQFNPKGLATFVEWHGRAAGDNTSNLHEILRSYAFNVNNGADCPFLTIVDEMKRQEASPAIAQRPAGGQK